MEVHMTKSKVIKKVSDFIEGRPQSITLNTDQLERLGNLEASLYCGWEDLKNFNEEIGNDHCICAECREKLKKDE